MKAKRLPSGNYRVQVADGYDENGKRIVKSFTAPTDWEAIKLAEDYKNGIENNREHMTVKQAVEAYIDSRNSIISPTTLHDYQTILKNRLTSIHNIDIHELTKLDVQKAINNEVSRGLGYKSLKNALALYRSSLACYGVTIAPTQKFTLPQKKAEKGDLPSLEKVVPIIIGSSVELPCLLSLLCGGLRISEVRGLQYRDITTDEEGTHFLHVNRVRVCINGHDEVKDDAKTVESARDVPVCDYVYRLIVNKPHNSDTDFIVDENYGAIKRRFDRLMKKNGIDMTFHDLRKEFATTMNGLGVQKEVLQMLGGWSNSSVLDSVYIRTPRQQLTDSMKLLDNYVSDIIKNNSNNSD